MKPRSRAILLLVLAVPLLGALSSRIVRRAGAQPGPTPPVARAPRLVAPGLLFEKAPAARTPAAPVAEASAPRVAVLATVPDSGRTNLILQPLDGTAPAAPVASFTHLRDTSVQGAVVPRTANVLVIAGTERRPDPAFGSSLLLLVEGKEAKMVSTQVYRGTRPLVLDDGRAFVQRGAEGPEPSDADLEAGRLRVDHLTVEQIDLGSGSAKVMTEFDGYIAFIAGALGHEIFVYRVGPEGADIIGIDADSGRQRTIQRPLVPYARDFSVDAQGEALLFTNADPDQPGQWVAERLSVAAPSAPVVPPTSRAAVAGKRERIATGSHPALAPTAWVNRTTAVSRDLRGLQVTGLRTGAPDKVPFTSGTDVVREFFTARGDTWALAAHEVEGKLSEPVVIQTRTMNVQKIAVPQGARIDVVGIVEQGEVAKPGIREIEPVAPRNIRVNPRLLKKYIAPQPGGLGDNDEALPR